MIIETGNKKLEYAEPSVKQDGKSNLEVLYVQAMGPLAFGYNGFEIKIIKLPIIK